MKIIVTTGSSGGHIHPAVSFLDALGEKHKEIDALLVLPKRSRINQALLDKYRVKYISTSKIASGFKIKNITAILSFLKGAWESLCLVAVFKPDIVVGFGSRDSVAVLLSAWLFRIKTLIHEQNVIPGRANRLLAPFADKVAISFAETKDYLKLREARVIFTGNPIRRQLKRIDRQEAADFFGLDKNKFTILVMGGSQGSRHINAAFLRAVKELPQASSLQVIHLTGIKDFAAIEGGYKDLNIGAKVFEFLNPMQYAYSLADLAISRSGATSIAELIYFQLPALLVPYPFAYKHQLHNALVLENKGCAVIINDGELDTDRLSRVLDGLVHNPDKVRLMHAGYHDIPKANANDLLVNEVMSLALS
jgi:UDP-N-acetylglucosamine--N-acetylmuramyl-(pentapeptide) pyrophosphoryl-undecaprenol N-acetylglucosamine transferase